jgi:hypothetical protein
MRTTDPDQPVRYHATVFGMFYDEPDPPHAFDAAGGGANDPLETFRRALNLAIKMTSERDDDDD